MAGTTRDLTREQWAARTETARRIARFNKLLERARAAVDGEPRLTPDELRQLAGVFGTAAGDQAAS
jgi:hypothetical protein